MLCQLEEVGFKFIRRLTICLFKIKICRKEPQKSRIFIFSPKHFKENIDYSQIIIKWMI
jgi:hypothetical protein